MNPNQNQDKKSAVPISDANEIPKEKSNGQEKNEQGYQDSQSCEQRVDSGLEDLCTDLIGLPFEAWTMFSRSEKALNDFERNALGARLAAIMRKHNVERYIKDELIFFGILGFAVTRRIKEERALAMAEIRKKQQEQEVNKDAQKTSQ